MALGISLALAACAGQSQSGAALPDGTYHYENVYDKGTIPSTITVRRESGAIVVREVIDRLPGDVAELRLDPQTYSVASFTASTADDGTVTIGPDGAVNTVGGNRATVSASVPGAPAFVDGARTVCYAILPALVHATGAQTLSAYFPGIVHGKGLGFPQRVFPVTMPRPDGVPEADASLGLGNPRSKGAAISIWYDPKTFVMDAAKLGSALYFRRVQ